jgi:hypothetical protein
MELYLYSLNMPSWRGGRLKHRDSFQCNVTLRSVVCYECRMEKSMYSVCPLAYMFHLPNFSTDYDEVWCWRFTLKVTD